MTTKDLTADLEQLAESSKALERLLRIPPTQVDRLLALLSDPRALHALRRLLKVTHQLQTGNSRPPSGRVADSAGAEDLKMPAILEELFSDRERFPTVTSIGDFSRKVFQINVNYNRDSRGAFVRKVIRAVEGNRKAMIHAENALTDGQLREHDIAYATLYNFIRGRMTG